MAAPTTSAASSWRPDGWLAQVWAPDATTVTLHHGPQIAATSSMRQVGDGWWETTDPELLLAHGTDYAFAVDGGPPLPDPRSAWQPAGVHAPSRVFDVRVHQWSDEDWPGLDVRGTVGYEVHVGAFTPAGTLDSAIARLDHLADLGVQTVELMPVAAFPGTHGWGYDGVALYAVHDPYGGPAALQRFVDAAHHSGIAVALAVVYNHLGPSGNYLNAFGPYFTETHQTPWGWAVNLDAPGAAGARAFIIDNALRWLRDFHVDTLRLDAVHALIDDSGRHLLAELSDRVAELSTELGRPMSLVAESDLNDPTMLAPTSAGGRGMTAQWADDVHHALHAWVSGEQHGYYTDFGSSATLAHALSKVFVHEGGWSTFRGKPWGAPVPDDLDGHRFVVFSANHDQVGNRALGDRPSQRLDGGRLAASAAAVLCAPFTPMLFMGEEWGAQTPFQYFTDHAEPELVEGIRRGRAEEFAGHGWATLYGGPVQVPDPQAPETFDRSHLDWSERTEPTHARLLSWYRTVIALRRQEPALASGDRRALLVTHTQDWVVMHRDDLMVALHIGADPVAIDLLSQEPGTSGSIEILASWDDAHITGGVLHLPGPGATIMRITPAEEIR